MPVIRRSRLTWRKLHSTWRNSKGFARAALPRTCCLYKGLSEGTLASVRTRHIEPTNIKSEIGGSKHDPQTGNRSASLASTHGSPSSGCLFTRISLVGRPVVRRSRCLRVLRGVFRRWTFCTIGDPVIVSPIAFCSKLVEAHLFFTHTVSVRQ